MSGPLSQVDGPAKDTKKKLAFSTNSQDSHTSLRVDSFSYLNNGGENFTFKVSGPVQDPAPAFSFPRERLRPINVGRTNCKNGIDVFGADKYFNVKLDRRVRVEPPVGPRNPSVCSQESNMNSQNVLLQRTHRIESQTKQKRLFGRRFFAGLVCQGPCFNKKSVHVNEIVAPGTTTESKPTRTGSKRVEHFASQVSRSGAENLTVEDEELKEEKPDEPRRSLEVFGSCNSYMKGGVARNLERKLSMLTWDAIPKSGQNLTISTPGNTPICDDMASDASSDLFEIENISSMAYSKLKVESDLYHMPSCMSPSPTTQYAPSEASIE
ncbi:protein PHYTOCHROME KINASE SUBSTRATE 3-like [Olea europaea var. sylvestris]|uniref:protein PHYTOCHROME KINASE SUBSTRATE 3-like n=1 Tax=Olea europaea var. sylvestris TaxID=158386 RepID=UPI000C1CD80C|nr:protein PHYTOCHROME KINASE SUBSTRATE 3-like [Olea europaea var. sylvestris]